MGEAIFVRDWADSSFGLLATWPYHLKFAVNVMPLMPAAAIVL